MDDITIRLAHADDLEGLLALYEHLNRDDELPSGAAAGRIWQEVLTDERISVVIAEAEGRPVSSCTLVVVPNLTRGGRPYGWIENVVTDPAYRRRGCGGAVLRHALALAWRAGCYKVMLMTGSKRESTLRFYESVGFVRDAKTGFVARPPEEAQSRDGVEPIP